jgi:dethiobiotin synthetase
VVVEGVGGFCVPLGPRADMGDLARRLRLPVIMVVGMRLGCLSHALLTAEAIERRGLTLAGWIANRIDADMRRYRENVRALQDRIEAPMLADVPRIERAGPRQRSMCDALDLASLVRWLPRRACA